MSFHFGFPDWFPDPSLQTEPALLWSDSGYEYPPCYLFQSQSYVSGGHDQFGLENVSSQFDETLRLNSFENTKGIKENMSLSEGQSLKEDKPGTTSNLPDESPE